MSTSTEPIPTSSHYQVPNWAGKPPSGFHLDVYKEGKLFQKIMIDEKKCYHFGRNPTLNDICIDHQSCSRIHAALVYHKHLSRAFLVDLGSTHGSFIGNIRLEAHKPTQLPVNSTFHFGASTRYYYLREKPNASNIPNSEGDANSENVDYGHLNLPDSELELDNLTEFNTVHNKRISMMGIKESDKVRAGPRTILVRFKEEEEIINPEDIDPSVGKFRNLVQTTVIPKKKMKLDSSLGLNQNEVKSSHILKPQIDSTSHHSSALNPIFSTSLSLKLGIPLPNSAPDVDLEASPEKIPELPTKQLTAVEPIESIGGMGLPKKKKYAKEAWPGRRPPLL